MSTSKRAPAGAAVLRGEVTAAIRRAVMQELAEVGYGRLSRRAGVGKTAVYRRWRSKLDLVLDVVSEVAERRLPLPDTGSLRGDIEVLLLIVAQALQHPLAGQIVPDLLAEAARNPQIAETLGRAIHTHQRAIGEALIERAVKRGELADGADPESAVDLIIGPLYWRLTVFRTALDTDQIPLLATAITAAITASLKTEAATR